jgi:hypothetical protein
MRLLRPLAAPQNSASVRSVDHRVSLQPAPAGLTRQSIVIRTGRDPRDVLTDFLQNTQYVLPGWGTGLLGDWSEWSLYCRASNLLVSPLLESQVQSSQCVTELTDLTNSASFTSEDCSKSGPMATARSRAMALRSRRICLWRGWLSSVKPG